MRLFWLWLLAVVTIALGVAVGVALAPYVLPTFEVLAALIPAILIVAWPWLRWPLIVLVALALVAPVLRFLAHQIAAGRRAYRGDGSPDR
jgi:hypothetical protein